MRGRRRRGARPVAGSAASGLEAFVRRAPIRPGVIGPMRSVPPEIDRPPYVGAMNRRGLPVPQVMVGEDLERMRRAGRIAAEVLLETGAAVAPGVTTDELDRIAHEAFLARGAYPSTLGYGTYRKSICTSVNEVVCHGIPDSRPLEEGDIVNVDVTAFVDGVHGDTSATFAVGGVDTLDDATRDLVAATHEATMRGIAAVFAGAEVREIGRAIERFARVDGWGVVPDYGGHGIGEVFHAPPHVFHVDDARSTMVLDAGTCLTVEPMLTIGDPETDVWDDGWTVVTLDGLPSAQFEHTICVTDGGAELLTVTADGRSAVTWPNDPV